MTTSPIIGVVDDDRSIRTALDRLLRSDGLTPEVFCSAEAVLTRERLEEISCLLVDLQMPGMNGLDLQDRLNAAPPHPPIIFISARDDPQVRKQAMQGGAVDFLFKPFHDQELLDAIAAAVAQGPAT
ncbi:MAG: response regulator [Gemmatimonadetes bacterium]|nr:response regulator [Gemmatimonadota bacterium]MCZ6918530.1 response regulator [Gemmatimonadota bacterium]